VPAPERKGFGSLMTVQVDGQVKIDYADGGVVCTIDAPMAAVAEGDVG
jgi:hypothetical protein